MDKPQELDTKNIESAIEAILFAAGHPVSYEKLGEALDLFESQVRKKVADFAKEYNADTRRGIMLLTFENSCQLCTREQYIPYIKDALGIKKGGNLSNSSLEVLAIVAYNEPVTRAFIDTVRKVDSAYVVSSLCEKNLIEACGRLDVPGRPHIYRTTPTFLRCFGIESLEQLPFVDIPRIAPEGEIIPLDIDVPEAEANSNKELLEQLIPNNDASEADDEAQAPEQLEIV